MDQPLATAPARLELLGTTHVAVVGKPTAVRSRKSRAIIAFLALAPRHRSSRAQLAGLLWSEGTDEAARVSLRQQLRTLKTELGSAADFLQSDRQDVWLAVAPDVDAVEAVKALGRGVVPDILIERRGLAESYLADIEGVDTTFDYWLAVQRESFSELLLQKLRTLMLRPASAEQAERAAMAMHNLDASNEEACRVLMRAALGRGDVSGALRVYNELWALLDTDFDMEPSAETQAFVAEIKAQPAPGGAVPRAADTPGDGHILILVSAFDHDGIGPEQERRVNGLRHELIGALTRFRDWSVREAGRPLDAAELARHKTYEISALASAEGDEVFISIVLRRHDDGTYLWSQRVSVQLDRWVSAKLDIIRKIATSLEVHLSAERVSQTADAADHSLDIYDRWLRGKSLTAHWQPESERRAEQIFRSLIAEAPRFPLSYVGVAQILTTRHHIFPGILRDRAGEEEALRLAKAAVKLDARDSRTQLCLAWSHIMVDHFDQAIFSYDLALQLNDNDPWTLTSCAQGLSYCNQKERARQLADRALEVAVGGAPMHWSYQMCVRFLDGDYPAALRAADQAEGSAFFVPAWKAATLHHLGEATEARAAIEQFRQDVQSHWHGTAPATPEGIFAWLRQCFPIRLKADRERLERGVLGAGLLEHFHIER
jgi:DNA-binding SARP family transcriptional activator